MNTPWLYATGNILMGGGDQILLAHARALKNSSRDMAILSLESVDRNKSMAPALEEEGAVILNNSFVDHVIVPAAAAILSPALILKVALNSARKLVKGNRVEALRDLRESLQGTQKKLIGLLQAKVFNLRFRRYLKSLNPQGVHVMHATPCAVLGPLPNITIPLLYTEILTPKFYKSWLPSLKPMLGTYSQIVVPAKTIATHLEEEFELSKPYTQIPFVSDLRDVAEKQPVNEKRFCCGVFARLSFEKGHRYFIEALKEIRTLCPNVTVIFAGSGPLREELKSLAKQHGVADIIEFIGEYQPSDLKSIMSRVDVVVLPSLVEGMPHVLVEATAFGKPAVVTNVGAVAEMVEENVNGFVVNAKDVSQLAKRTTTILNDVVVRSRMSDAAFNIYQERYDYGVVLNKIEELCENAIKTK